MPRLAHSRITADDATPSVWLYFLHGIYGAGRNWRSIAREVSNRRSAWGGLLVDLRLHGESRGFEPPHTLAACTRDVSELAAGRGSPEPPTLVLGHSFGGKVALSLLEDGPHEIRQAWIVDSTPAPRAPGGSALRMLRAVRENPGPFEDRARAIGVLEERGFDRLVASWMATNLESGDGGLRWRFDPDEMEALLEDFFQADLWGVVERPPRDVALHFVKGEDSDVLRDEDCRRIEAAGRETGRLRLHRVAGGHWLNVDNPEALVDLLTAHLPEPE